MFNKIRTIGKIAKTVSSPITHARNIIKSKFQKTSPTITSVKPKGGTKKSDQIKKSNKILKDLDKTMKKDMTPELKAKGDKLKKEVQKTQKEVYRSNFNKGSKDPVGKKKNGKTSLRKFVPEWSKNSTLLPVGRDEKAKGDRSKFNRGSKDPVGKKKNKFPDHSGDGQITQKDILMAKGVIPKPKSKKKVI